VARNQKKTEVMNKTKNKNQDTEKESSGNEGSQWWDRFVKEVELQRGVNE